MRRISLLP